MYFKKLELIGFKSFAEKTKLHFEPGVTAVVGPNGCGKSNIADSIKWVLGEQAPKSLRASRMEDVIFNGTDKKEPISLAEVSITLSNESKILPIEYDEVTVTRRLFRSGESEYLLNKMPVRLKDIQELLMGTGIGTESYSLIEQGQIDLILSSRPEERRYIFEEASGITRYKSKKKEALNKLEQTESNLVRLNDIINEVRRQISSIERQAKKAEKYKKEFEKLKDLDTKFSLFNYKNLKNEEKITYIEIEDIRNKERDLIAKVAYFNEVAEKLKADMELISDKFSTLQATLLERTSSIDKNSHKISVNEERIRELERMNLLLNEEIKKAESRRIDLEDSLKILRQKLSNFTKEKGEKEDLISQKEEEYSSLSKEIEDYHRGIADGRNQTVENLARQSKLNNESARLSTEIQNRSSRLRRLQIEIEKVRGELSSSETEFSQIAGEAKDIEGILSNLNEERLSHQKELDRHRERLDTLKENLVSCQKETSLLKSRLQFLEELIQNYEGFEKGAKHILEAKEKGMFSKIDGPVCNIVDVEEGFESIFELALGEELQSFIVNSRQEAQELLSYLEANNLGRTSLIIMDDLPKVNPCRPVLRFSLKPLLDIVKVKDEYRKVLTYLLKNTYIAEDKEKNLLDVINKLGSEARIITGEKNLIQPGRISGGAVRGSSDTSLLGREKKISQTCLKMEEFNKKAMVLNEVIKSEQSNLESIEKEIESVVDRFRREEIKLANINTKKQAIKGQLDRLNDEKLVLNTEIEELKGFLGDLNSRQEIAKKELKEIEEGHLVLENLIISSQGSIEKKSKQKEELLVRLTQYKTEIVSLSREENSQLESVTREESAFVEVSSGIEAKKKQLIDGAQRIEELAEENNSLELQNSKNSSERENLEKDIEKIRNEKVRLMEEVAREDQKIQGEKSLLEELRDNLHKLEMKKTEVSYKQNSLRERVLQTYKVDLDQIRLLLEDGLNWEEIQVEIEELKVKLEKMGTVNLVAIEEHQELQERFNFLTHQQQDLLNAKDSLLKAIQKINRTTRSLFLDTFTKIQTEFRGFFRLLFGGGQAELLLLDEKDVLESGIEIIVRPPGKKLQNISLLSGGEKALTAIALLFAIFKVKPSPFCVLDEIDAPLDESNIGRFSSVLRDFVKSSQFIIITHNKKTIELADVMYGITMEQSGISKVVSVKFADAEKEEKKAEILT